MIFLNSSSNDRVQWSQEIIQITNSIFWEGIFYVLRKIWRTVFLQKIYLIINRLFKIINIYVIVWSKPNTEQNDL